MSEQTPVSVTSFERGAWTTQMLAPGETLTFYRENEVITLRYHTDAWSSDGEHRPALTLTTKSA